MSGKSDIQWTDATWNPVTGCTKVSPGCAHCYAERITERLHGPGSFEEIVLHPDRLEYPLHWRKPRRVFVNSMSDLFHNDVPYDFIIKVFGVMQKCPQHTFQVLTKRATGMYDVVRAIGRLDQFSSAWPLPNVWLGVSVENQHFANERIPLLLRTPAAVRFISAEPLLGPVCLTDVKETMLPKMEGDNHIHIDATERVVPSHIDWVICGGESGTDARAMQLSWARSLRDQCKSAGVAFFMKQLGSRPESHQKEPFPFAELFKDSRGQESAGVWALRDRGHHGNIDEFPEDLRIREYPRETR